MCINDQDLSVVMPCTRTELAKNVVWIINVN